MIRRDADGAASVRRTQDAQFRVESMFFKAKAKQSLDDAALQKNLTKAKGKFVDKRAAAFAELAADGCGFAALRDAGQAIRQRSLADLDHWLEAFEKQATARGAEVLWARDGQQIRDLVIEIAQRHGVGKIIKSKSMLSEEAGLNAALAAAGITPVETDLGEYIIQLAGETPSHIIAPAVHKNLDEVADLFQQHHGSPRKTEIPALTREARAVLREHFLSAGMGISGGNFLIAESGSVALVTNEGNGRMVTTLPKVHVVITGVEKVVPTLAEFATLMRLLPRSATGQAISNYVSLLTGTKGAGDADGPEFMYFILVDNGRVELLGGEHQDILRCIRCGACMNHCPVYQTIGGHAYGWVYPGPMGAVLTPLYTGLQRAGELPQAATLCHQCDVVCPVGIPLPELLRKLRRQAVDQGLRPWSERLALRLWRFVAERPALYAAAVKFAVSHLRWLAGGQDRIQVFGLAPEWTLGRDLPAPQQAPFRELLKQRRVKPARR
ncbi:MAG TPA: LutB/LldF family L-lactate oxidation iron-sulfur protein [Rhodocyclaceae bacterium]|nr:LutB/LldF family L-lactate oxidation iron-sulfur protein [Rhodocyclaceae bacterium]